MTDQTTARDLERTIALMRASESVTLTGRSLENVLRALAAAPDATAIERDKAARAVVRDWAHYRALPVRGDLANALDALAWAYEGGGQDR